RAGDSRWLRRAASLAACCILPGASGCWSGRGSVSSDAAVDQPPTQPANPRDTYSIGGEVSGLLSSGLVLQLNGAGDTSVVRNGSFLFPDGIASGASSAVAAATMPSKPTQSC